MIAVKIDNEAEGTGPLKLVNPLFAALTRGGRRRRA